MLDKIWFAEYMDKLATAYSNIPLTKKKVDLYYDHFNSKGFVQSQYEYAANWLFNHKRDNNFPTMAEIIDAIRIDADGKDYVN